MGTVVGFNEGREWHTGQRNRLGETFVINGKAWEYIEVKDYLVTGRTC